LKKARFLGGVNRCGSTGWLAAKLDFYQLGSQPEELKAACLEFPPNSLHLAMTGFHSHFHSADGQQLLGQTKLEFLG